MFGPDFATIQPVPFGNMVQQRGQAEPEAHHGRRAFLSRLHRRRFACLRAAAEVLDVLPAEGECLHAVMTGLYDLMHLLIVLLERLHSPCLHMGIATLSLSRRNVQEMAALFDQAKVGRLDVLVSDFFRKHDDDIFAELVAELRQRGQRVAAARSHCKIITLALDDGRRYVLAGSANLRTNKNLEQFALTRDAALYDHYAAWLSEMVTAHEVGQADGTTAG